MTCGIYCIENLIDGKKYIGQGSNVEERMWNYHKGCNYLLNALSYFGEENFKRYIVDECSPENIDELEIYYIDILKSHCSEWGYNISYGGAG